MSEQTSNNPNYLLHHPDAVVNRVRAFELALVEKPYRDMAAQALMLGRQAVEREQSYDTTEPIDDIDNELKLDREDFMAFAEANGKAMTAATRAWNAVAIHGAAAFRITLKGTWDEAPLPIHKVYERLDGLVPAGATPTQKYNRVRKLGMPQFGTEAYDLLLAYCQDKLQSQEQITES